MDSFLRKVVLALDRHGVDYCLVGGFAVAFHGAIRGTVDIDAIIQHTEDQFNRCEKALKSIGLTPRLPVSASDVFHFKKEFIKKRNLVAWSFLNPDNPLEVVDVIITKDKSHVKTSSISVFGDPIKIIALPDLIKMKGESNRPQYREDLKALKQLLKEKKSEK